MPRVLATWLGDTDLRSAARNNLAQPGPIASALAALPFDELLLLTDRAPTGVQRLRDGTEVSVEGFVSWIGQRSSIKVHVRHAPLSSPIHFGEIYQAARRAIEQVRARGPGVELTFHTSPGTPPMAAVWIILAKTVFPAELIQSSLEAGVGFVAFPFELSAEFLPDLLRQPDQNLARLAAGRAPEAAEFKAILHRSDVMRRIVARAQQVALRSVPVLLEGESGTGKELFARAIRAAGPRQDKPFVPVNCSAIPPELLESVFFGHKKGSFSGAVSDHKGHFEAANGGTLFLDEVGELPLALQAKLLRVLEDQKVTPVGTSKEIQVDVRIIAATNRTLLRAIEERKFREDLFYRLAVAVIRIPPLREREGDVGLLVDRLLEKVNKESEKEPGYETKKLTPAARQLLLQHPWPGNVRELLNTLRRAAVWSAGMTIGVDEVREVLLDAPEKRSEGEGEETILHRPLGDGFHVREVLETVKRHYVERAIKEAGGNLSQAARLLGEKNYQTVAGWVKKYEGA